MLLYFGLLLILKDKSQISVKNILLTGLIVEIFEGILSLYGSFFLIGGGVAILFNALLTWTVEFFILYRRYYKKNKISEKQVVLLYIITFIPTFIISVIITNFIFTLLGIPNAFVVGFI
ncbi:MAG: hypothetical protein ACTSQG_03445 [Promethearchaeota archaeon]